jgi:DNA-binding helix-hairpin-helix protein with protein kinase domain
VSDPDKLKSFCAKFSNLAVVLPRVICDREVKLVRENLELAKQCGVGEALEEDIKNLRYAYARDHQNRGISPPPRSIPVSILPEAVEALFQTAFTEPGAAGQRPSAGQWVAALDEVRSKLKKCSASAMHIYPNHLSVCPWCALENQGVAYFIEASATVLRTASGFVLAQVWAAIEVITPPPALRLPSPGAFQVVGRPLSAAGGTNHSPFPIEFKIFMAALIFAFVILSRFFDYTTSFFLGIMASGILMAGIVWFSLGFANDDGNERIQRKKQHENAQKEYDKLLTQARLDNARSESEFNACRRSLTNFVKELKTIEKTETQEISQLSTTRHELQLLKFLQTFSIASTHIPKVEPEHKARLRAQGITTAADLSSRRLAQISGLSKNLRRALSDWRRQCEQQFQFNPVAAGVSVRDQNAVRAKFSARRAYLERALLIGPAELQQIQQQAAAQQSQLQAAAQKLAQTQADLKVVMP